MIKSTRFSEEDLRELKQRMGISRGGVKEHTPDGGREGGAVSERRASGTTVKSSARTSHATTQQFFIPGPLPGANDIISRHRMVYVKLKQQWGMDIGYLIGIAKLKPVHTCTITFAWQEANNRRDDDNVMFGQKFILDALQATGIIPNDRRSCVLSLTHGVTVRPTCPGVWVTIEEVQP